MWKLTKIALQRPCNKKRKKVKFLLEYIKYDNFLNKYFFLSFYKTYFIIFMWKFGRRCLKV